MPFEPSATGAPQPVPTPVPVPNPEPVTPVIPKTMKEKIEERCQKPENNFLFQSILNDFEDPSKPGPNFCSVVNHYYSWKNIDNIRQLLDKQQPFCNDNFFGSDMNSMNSIYSCKDYEEAFKTICEKDYEPYNSVDECTLVNLYGTHNSYWLLGLHFSQIKKILRK